MVSLTILFTKTRVPSFRVDILSCDHFHLKKQGRWQPHETIPNPIQWSQNGLWSLKVPTIGPHTLSLIMLSWWKVRTVETEAAHCWVEYEYETGKWIPLKHFCLWLGASLIIVSYPMHASMDREKSGVLIYSQCGGMIGKIWHAFFPPYVSLKMGTTCKKVRFFSNVARLFILGEATRSI